MRRLQRMAAAWVAAAISLVLTNGASSAESAARMAAAGKPTTEVEVTPNSSGNLYLEEVETLAATPPLSFYLYPGWYVIRVHGGTGQGGCLDADTNTINGNGTKIRIWQCADPPSGNQIWHISSNGFIKNAHSNRYLSADLHTICCNGGKVVLWDYTSGNTAQQWSIVCCGPLSYRGGLRLRNNFSGRYLQAESNAQGAKVQLWTSQPGDARQYWKPDPWP